MIVDSEVEVLREELPVNSHAPLSSLIDMEERSQFSR